MENVYAGPSYLFNIKHEKMGNIVDVTERRWSTAISYTPTDYTHPFSDMPVTLVKTLGSHKYYKFNSNDVSVHFSIDTPNLKRRNSKDYVQIMIPYINNSADDLLYMYMTTYYNGANVGEMYYRDAVLKGHRVLIGLLPIDILTTHTDLQIGLLNGNGYDDIYFGLPTINDVGCEEIVQ
jgi:hypothetical protein